MKQELENIDFVVRINQTEKLNPEILDRFPNLPKDYLLFLNDIEYAVTKDEKAWFNTIGDFNGTSDNGFRWNEFEFMSLEAFEDSHEEEAKIVTRFWDKHIPILMSCRNFYCYFALSLDTDNFGQVVYGSEPFFEEKEFVANDFSEFIRLLADKTLDKKFIEQVL